MKPICVLFVGFCMSGQIHTADLPSQQPTSTADSAPKEVPSTVTPPAPTLPEASIPTGGYSALLEAQLRHRRLLQAIKQAESAERLVKIRKISRRAKSQGSRR